MSRKDRRKTLAIPYTPALKQALSKIHGRSASARLRTACLRGLRADTALASVDLRAKRALHLQLEPDLRQRIASLATTSGLSEAEVVLCLAGLGSVELP